MKLTVILLLIVFHVSAGGYSQTVTLSEKNAPLQKILKAIERQTDYVFFFEYEALQKARVVTIEVKNVPLLKALDICFRDQPVTYSIVGKNILIDLKKAQFTNGMILNEKALKPIEVRGVITDENGAPAQGVNVMVKGTSKGTTTNLKGEFILSGVNENSVLIITSVGYNRLEVPVKNRQLITVQLNIAAGNLDELQIVAYGTISKRLSTGNISSIKARDIEKQPVNNPLLALQGRVPGLFIEQTNGVPGTGVKVRIQGQNSISSGNDPLYVIDGVPYISDLLPALSGIQGNSGTIINGQVGTGNPLSYLNPSDIESIEILKDADATGIYGSRAANGAILITTKKGKSGQTKVDITCQKGWGKVSHFVDLLNTQQYLEVRHEAFKNDGTTPSLTGFPAYDLLLWDTTKDTNWQDELIGGTAEYSDAQLSISGGSSNTTFLIGSGYHRETTVFPGNLKDQKASLHFNINHSSSNQRFRLRLGGSYLVNNSQLMFNDLTRTAMYLPPNAPDLYNADGTLNWAPDANGNSTWVNPLALLEKKFKLNVDNIISSGFISYQLLPGFEVKSNLGYTNLQKKEVLLNPLSALAPERRQSSRRSTSFGNGYMRSWTIEPQVTFNQKLLSYGTLNILIGSTLLESESYQQQYSGTGFISDHVMENIRAAANLFAVRQDATSYRYGAIFGRFNFNWKNRYILNLNARRDGSSRFGSKNLFHTFGSVGGAYLFSNEIFIQRGLPFVSFGKLRLSYGTTGNDQIGDYRFMNLYNTMSRPIPYQTVTGIAPTGLPNPYIEWEETRKLQVGLDLGFIKDRVLFTSNYYHNRSSNLLQGYGLPIYTGTTQLDINLPAIVQNSGWEFSLQTTNLSIGQFTWSSGINLTIPKNKLIRYDGLAQSTQVNSLLIGEPISIQKRFKFAGVDPATGVYQFVDAQGNLTSAPKLGIDNYVPVDQNPKYYGGWHNSFEYKGLTLDFLIQFVKTLRIDPTYFGNSFYTGFFYSDAVDGIAAGNLPTRILDRWQKPGDNNTIQKYSANPFSPLFNPNYIANSSSDVIYVDGSYLRLKNASLSWQLPKVWQKKAHLQSLRVFVQGQNLFTITKYKGLDPESASTLSIPPLRIWTFGTQISF